MLTAIAPIVLSLGLALAPTTGEAGWPLDPRPEVVEQFAPPEERWGAGHRGVDLQGTAGQAVLAAQEGTITFAGMLAGRGVVVVGHGARRTTYEPVAASVQVGDRVHAGEVIGSLQTFGSHCWPRTCLHWGLVEGEQYLDPLSLVGAGPVRLLPLYSSVDGSAWAPLALAGSPVPVVRTPAPAWLLVRPGGVPAGTPDAGGPW